MGVRSLAVHADLRRGSRVCRLPAAWGPAEQARGQQQQEQKEEGRRGCGASKTAYHVRLNSHL